MSYLDWDTTNSRQQRRRRYNLLDGVDSQAGSSKPTVRSDNTTLQTGDRWLDTTDRIWFYWNGTYWLSEVLHRFSAFTIATLTATYAPGGLPTSTSYNLWLERWEVAYNIAAGTVDASNRWTFNLAREDSGGATTEDSINTVYGSGGTKEFLSATLNLHRDVSALGTKFYRMNVARVGTPPGITNGSLALYYRLAKP